MQRRRIPLAYTDLTNAPPQWKEQKRRHWYSPAVNFVVESVHFQPGATLEVEDNPDEYMLILSNDAPTVRVSAGDRHDVLGGRSLVIFTPGASSCIALTEGRLYRAFSRLSPEYRRAHTVSEVADDANVADYVSWPEPSDGYRMRTYRLKDYAGLPGRRRVFRSTNLMAAMGESRREPREADDLSPHSYADFQQNFLVTEGQYIHHVRRPWGRDSTQWYESLP